MKYIYTWNIEATFNNLELQWGKLQLATNASYLSCKSDQGCLEKVFWMIEIVTILNQNWSLALHKRESVQNTNGYN
jgi:hypothetical protein